MTVETEQEFSFAAPVRLFSGPHLTAPTGRARTYDVARDGRFLMIQTGDVAGGDAASASIVVVQSWFEELVQRVPARP